MPCSDIEQGLATTACGPNSAPFLFFYSPHTQIGFFTFLKRFKKKKPKGNILKYVKLL